MSWTDERVEVLKKLHADGLSCSQIARQLGGVSRNAVIGKINRMGLSGRAVASPPKRVKAVRPPRAVKPRPVALPPVREARPLLPPDQIAKAPKPWLERRFGECAAPVGGEGAETLSCCNPCGDASYCDDHARRFFTAPKTTFQELSRSLRRLAA